MHFRFCFTLLLCLTSALWPRLRLVSSSSAILRLYSSRRPWKGNVQYNNLFKTTSAQKRTPTKQHRNAFHICKVVSYNQWHREAYNVHNCNLRAWWLCQKTAHIKLLPVFCNLASYCRLYLGNTSQGAAIAHFFDWFFNLMKHPKHCVLECPKLGGGTNGWNPKQSVWHPRVVWWVNICHLTRE